LLSFAVPEDKTMYNPILMARNSAGKRYKYSTLCATGMMCETQNTEH
jgi:hypothetical protein